MAERVTGTTKLQLIDAAEHEFAEHGIHGTQLRDINRRAGQSNNSALHYHFGSREGLLDAVLSHHAVDLNERRSTIIAGWAGQSPDVAEILRAVAEPLAAELATASGQRFLQILFQVRDKSGIRRLNRLGDQTTPHMQWLYGLLIEHLGWLPDEVRTDRLSIWIDMMLGSLASRAEGVATGLDLRISDEEYLINLIDMGVAALQAPSRVGAGTTRS